MVVVSKWDVLNTHATLLQIFLNMLKEPGLEVVTDAVDLVDVHIIYICLLMTSHIYEMCSYKTYLIRFSMIGHDAGHDHSLINGILKALHKLIAFIG